MTDKILIEFEEQIDALVQQHSDELIMLPSTGTVKNLLDRMVTTQQAMARIDTVATEIANSLLANETEDRPGLKAELIAIAAPKIRAYIMAHAPGTKS